MSTPRFLPWGLEPLVPHLRASAAAQGVVVPAGPTLDIGAGAEVRAAFAPGAHTSAPTLATAPHGPFALVVAWPGPGRRSDRSAWWRRLASRLVPGGVAAVQLDVLPGWHALGALQDMGRFHASRTGLSQDAAFDAMIEHTRAILGADEGRWAGWLGLAAAIRADDPWALPDLVSDPLHAAGITAWADEARAAGLHLAGDARGPTGGRRPLPDALHAWIDQEVSLLGDPAARDALVDNAVNQHTRLALFTKAPPAYEAPHLAAGTHAGPAYDRPHWWSLEPPHPAPESMIAAHPQAGAIQALIDRVSNAAPRFVPAAGLDPALVIEAWRLGEISLRDGPVAVAGAPTGEPREADLPAGLTLTAHGRLVPTPAEWPTDEESRRLLWQLGVLA